MELYLKRLCTHLPQVSSILEFHLNSITPLQEVSLTSWWVLVPITTCPGVCLTIRGRYLTIITHPGLCLTIHGRYPLPIGAHPEACLTTHGAANSKVPLISPFSRECNIHADSYCASSAHQHLNSILNSVPSVNLHGGNGNIGHFLSFSRYPFLLQCFTRSALHSQNNHARGPITVQLYQWEYGTQWKACDISTSQGQVGGNTITASQF